MSKSSETGHAKNLTNFMRLIAAIMSYQLYNPAKRALTAAMLHTLYDTCNGDSELVKTKKTAHDIAVNDRQQVFKGAKALATRIFNAIASSDVKQEIIDDAATINRKIQGKRRSAIDEAADPNGEKPKHNSSSQQSFDLIIDHYKKLWSILTAEAGYIPNERELSADAVKNYIDMLEAANKAEATTLVDYDNALITRQRSFYAEPLGMVPIAAAVKTYVKSAYSGNSPEFKKVNSIPFHTIDD